MRDQTGRTFVITGGSSGIGAATASALLEAGATAVVAVRDPAKARRVLGGAADLHRLDLADLASIRSFAAGLGTDVDVLINNAGVMGVPQNTTVDGFETQLGVNHLGPFALTGLLLPRLRDRVVTVSSQGHRQGTIDLTDPHWRHRRYDPSAAYAASKLANLLFTYELQRHLDTARSPVRSLAAHPGLAHSELRRHTAPTLRLRITAFAQRRLRQSAAAGALPILHAAIADLPGGTYIGPDGFYELRGTPKIVDSSRATKDQDMARRL